MTPPDTNVSRACIFKWLRYPSYRRRTLRPPAVKSHTWSTNHLANSLKIVESIPAISVLVDTTAWRGRNDERVCATSTPATTATLSRCPGPLKVNDGGRYVPSAEMHGVTVTRLQFRNVGNSESPRCPARVNVLTDVRPRMSLPGVAPTSSKLKIRAASSSFLRTMRSSAAKCDVRTSAFVL
jgi:hypothetical protein